MSLLHSFFCPLIDAFFCPGLSFSYRWRLLGFQPIAFLTQCIQWLPNIRSNKYAIHYIPLKRHPGQFVRAAIFQPKTSNTSRPRPLHINIHGGGFIGGLPEGDARFCERVAESTGAVVVSTSYRFAPRHTFPVAHEDIQDVAAYLVEQGSEIWNLDSHLITVSGFSAGGNLALGLSQVLAQTEYAVKGSVTFYAVVSIMESCVWTGDSSAHLDRLIYVFHHGKNPGRRDFPPGTRCHFSSRYSMHTPARNVLKRCRILC